MFGNAFLAKPSGDHLGDNLPLVAEMSPWPINQFLSAQHLPLLRLECHS